MSNLRPLGLGRPFARFQTFPARPDAFYFSVLTRMVADWPDQGMTAGKRSSTKTGAWDIGRLLLISPIRQKSIVLYGIFQRNSIAAYALIDVRVMSLALCGDRPNDSYFGYLIPKIVWDGRGQRRAVIRIVCIASVWHGSIRIFLSPRTALVHATARVVTSRIPHDATICGMRPVEK